MDGNNLKKIKISFILLLLIALIWLFYPRIASAALSTLSDVMTRIAKSPTTSSHDILFTLGGSTTLDAGETVIVDFHEDEADFTVDGAATVVADLDITVGGAEKTIVDVDGSCVGHSGANDMVAQVNDSTGVLTITACGSFTSSGAGAIINVEYGTAATGGTNRVTNPGTADSYIIDITAATDTGKLAAVIVDNEQVSLTGSVDPSITFSLDANASAFGALSVSSINTCTPNITLTIGTNAQNGYTITVQDSGNTTNPGFYNSSASYLIGSANAAFDDNDLLEIGQEGYGIQASSAGSTIAARYDQSGNNVGGLEITATPLASYATKMTANHTITIVHKAAIATFTSAGNYADTLTYIATGNF
jgi:hypothetical protein